MAHKLALITDFFDAIGLDYVITDVRADSFMTGLDIINGVLHIDENTLSYEGDALHEAGHIAVTEGSARKKLQGDVQKCGHGPGHEMAAIAWSWAALTHIGLEPSVVFHDKGYKDGSESIITAFEQGNGFGTPLLVYWQMCQPPGNYPEGFPNMEKWLRQADAK